MNINFLKQRKAAVISEAETIVALCEQDSRSMTDEETQLFNSNIEQAEKLQASIDRAEKLNAEEVRSAGASKDGFKMPTDEELRALLLMDEVSERSMDTSNTSDVVIPEVQRDIMRKVTADSPIRKLAAAKSTSSKSFEIPVQINGATVAEAAENDARNETAGPYTGYGYGNADRNLCSAESFPAPT